MKRASDDEAIAAYLRERGATRCPTAFVLPTRAAISPADRDELRRRQQEQAEAALLQRTLKRDHN